MIFVAIAFMAITLDPAGSSGTETTPTRANPALDGVISTGEYEYLEKLEDEEFEVSWTVNGSRIHMGLWVKSTGWVSLGLDPADPYMTNADMIFGWVSGGTAYMKDAFSTGKYGPHPEDTTLGGTYDIISFAGAEDAGYTTIEFVREMTTGDPYDKSFVNGTAIKIIWAYGDTDTWTDMHVSDGRGNLTLGGTPPIPPNASSELDGIIEQGEYNHSSSYDSGNFLLYWNVTGEDIIIGMKALASGWISLGISPTTMMQDADMLFGWVAGTTPYAEDSFSTGTTGPHPRDTELGGTNDIKAFNATESGGWTTVEIRRALVTGDPYDRDIVTDTPLSIIWGYSDTDSFDSMHTAVGYGTWRVNASAPPQPPPPRSDFDGVIGPDEYGNLTKTDGDRFELYWNVNGTSIDIGIRAEVTGYVSIGIDPTDRMKDADLIFGWVEGGLARAEDHFSTGATGPHSLDQDLGGTFDIISYNGTESGGWTTFEFRRNLTTGDAYDRTIGTGVAFPLIWAVSDSDDPTAIHARRGTIMWNLSNATVPPPPPPPPPHLSDFDGIISEGEYTDSKTFDSDRFELHWNVTRDEISIGIRAEATGWISLGIDPSVRMDNADMLLGYHDGSPHLLDQFSTGPEGPHPEDTALGGTDDILDFNVTESGEWTTIEFRRNLSAADQYDKSINRTELMTIIWAVSDSDDPTSLHTRRGTTTWKLTSPATAPPPQKNTTLDGIVLEDEYDDSASFGDGSFVIHWSINGSRIWMAMVGQTEGWVSIGFEPTSMMKDADMLIGWVGDDSVGLWDTYSTGELGPHPVDTDLGGTDDLLSFNGTQSGGFTTIEFVRELDTGDLYDKVIPSSGSLNVIWGLGSSDDPESSHTHRGSGTLLLYAEEPTPHDGLDGIISTGEYRDSASFDFDNFRVHWTILEQELHMAISAKTVGWVSIGFDPKDIMKDSDVVLGWVENGVVHIIDGYSTGQYGPHPPDTHLGGTMDILQYNGTEADGLTTIEFVRNISTGDDYDKDIPTSGNLNIMWAYGEHDDFGETHSKRGFAVLTIGPGVEEPPIEADLDGLISPGEYDYNGSFGEGLITIYWKLEGDSFRMAIQGKTTGWVSIGIGYSTAMADSDMIFGWVEDDGTVKVIDAYSTGPTGPHPADTDQGGTNDIISFGGREINGVTTIEFVRKLDTGDDMDNPIPKNGTVKIIWGVGGSDSFDNMHTRVGYGTIDIASGETSSEEPVTLWPIHAIFMTLGAAGMITAWVSQYRKKWRSFLKYHMYVMSGSVVMMAVGLAMGYYMVESGTGVHLRVLHSWFGALAILASFTALGLGLYFKHTRIMKHKRPTIKIHKYVGRVGAGSFILVAGMGFYQAIIVNEQEPELWFVGVMALSLLALVGTITFLIVKGRPTTNKIDPSPEKAIGIQDEIDEE